MKYQDTRINGTTIESGNRECEQRYFIIKEYCKTLNKSFSVLDIGANMSYFGLRLIEDFQCNVIAFEFHQYESRLKIISQNKTNKLMYLNRKVSITDLDILNSCSHFDVILALSVLHHVPGSVKQWIEKLKLLGDNLIIELAINDSKRVESRIDYEIPEGIILGYGNSHLDKSVNRPIILLKNTI